MRFVKRSIFNLVFQPKRIGKHIIDKAEHNYRDERPSKSIKRTKMQVERAMRGGKYNSRYSRAIRLQVLIKFFIKRGKQSKKRPSFMLTNARMSVC